MVKKEMDMGFYNPYHSKEDINGFVDLTLRLGLPVYHKNQNNPNIISQTQMLHPHNQLQPQPQQQAPYFNYIEYAYRLNHFHQEQAMSYKSGGNINLIMNEDVNSSSGSNLKVEQNNNVYLTSNGSYNNSTTYYDALLEEDQVTLAPLPYSYNNRIGESQYNNSGVSDQSVLVMGEVDPDDDFNWCSNCNCSTGFRSYTPIWCNNAPLGSKVACGIMYRKLEEKRAKEESSITY
uniref:Uncharacterized protein n=1 Tax=Cannabis sativa TaxID=3483 RepID=A0A803PIS2_CANSA